MNFEKIFQESKEMSPEEKMDAWHNGTRGFNIKAANVNKLRSNLEICKNKGYDFEASKIEDELKARLDKVQESWGKRKSLKNRVKESTDNDTESKNTEGNFDNPLWKTYAVGEDEVRELFNNIRNGNDNIDKQFVEKIYELFPDMPHAVEILKGSKIEDNEDWEKFNTEQDAFLEGLLYFSNEKSSGICEPDTLWDLIGDGKNPFDIYIATYSRSDGMENTAVLIYGDDWYKICRITDDVKEALWENIFDVDNGGEVLNACYYKSCHRPLFLNNKSLI